MPPCPHFEPQVVILERLSLCPTLLRVIGVLQNQFVELEFLLAVILLVRVDIGVGLEQFLEIDFLLPLDDGLLELLEIDEVIQSVYYLSIFGPVCRQVLLETRIESSDLSLGILLLQFDVDDLLENVDVPLVDSGVLQLVLFLVVPKLVNMLHEEFFLGNYELVLVYQITN